jgi:predicted amidophosphoribosyltransferase
MLLTHQQCYECGKETPHHNGHCAYCWARQAKTDRKNHFDSLDRMTLEQRVRRVEEALYNQSNPPERTDR